MDNIYRREMMEIIEIVLLLIIISQIIINYNRYKAIDKRLYILKLKTKNLLQDESIKDYNNLNEFFENFIQYEDCHNNEIKKENIKITEENIKIGIIKEIRGILNNHKEEDRDFEYEMINLFMSIQQEMIFKKKPGKFLIIYYLLNLRSLIQAIEYVFKTIRSNKLQSINPIDETENNRYETVYSL